MVEIFGLTGIKSLYFCDFQPESGVWNLPLELEKEEEKNVF